MRPRPARRLGKRARILDLLLTILLVAAIQLIVGAALTNGQTPPQTDPSLAAALHPGAHEAVHPTARFPLATAAFGSPLAPANDPTVIGASRSHPAVTSSTIVGASLDEFLGAAVIAVGTAPGTYSFSCDILGPGLDPAGT